MTELPHLIAIATHSDTIHLLSFTRSPSPQLHLRHSLELQDQPSWISRSVSRPELLYVTSWVNDKVFLVRFGEKEGMEVVDEVFAGGGGPTHMEPTRDGKGLLVVHYRTSSLTYLPLLPSGNFDHSATSSSSNYTHTFPFHSSSPTSALPHPRQTAAHPHQIIPFGSNGNEWLIPDLGNDVIWKMRWGSSEKKWVEVESFDCEKKSGPRHGVLLPDGKHLYILNELNSSLSLVCISPNHPQTLPRTFSTTSLLPPSLRSLNPLDYDPNGFAMIASSIALLPSVNPKEAGNNGKEKSWTILATNRDAPVDLSPEGDTFVQFSLSLPNTSTTTSNSNSELNPNPPNESLPSLSEPTFHEGAGRHLRGLITHSPLTSTSNSSSSAQFPHPPQLKQEDPSEYVLIMGRNEGGLSLYERKWCADEGEEGEILVPLLMNVLQKEVEKPVGGIWLA